MELPTVVDSERFHFGDIVCLNGVVENGFVASDGFTNNFLWFDVLKNVTNPCPPNPVETCFQIVSTQEYTARKALEKYLSKIQQELSYVQSAEAATDMELQKHLRALQQETMLNEFEEKRQVGKLLVYGHVILLRHMLSGKYLTIDKAVAQHDRRALAVVLEEFASESATFQLLPAYKTLQLGATVRVGDVVIFLSDKYPNQYVSVSKISGDGAKTARKIPPDVAASMEVNAGSLPMKCRLWPMCTHAVAGEYGAKYLRGNDAISMLHKDCEGLVMNEGPGIHLRIPKSRIGSTGNRVNSNSYWQVEPEDHMWGGMPVEYEKSYRLRHIATGLYLSAPQGTSKTASRGSTTTELALSRSRDDDLTLFRFKPFHGDKVTKEKWVYSSTAVFLEHTSGLWLLEGGILNQVAGKNAGKDGGQPSGLSQQRKLRRVVLSPTFSERDVLHISIVERKYLRSLWEAIRTVEQIEMFGSVLDGCRSAEDFKIAGDKGDRTRDTIAKAIMTMSVSKQMNPYIREGIPVREQQKVYREQGVAPVIMKCLTLPFQRGLQPRGQHVTSIETMPFVNLLNICKLLYRFMLLFVKGYKRNKKECSAYIPEIQSHCGGEMKAALTLQEILKDSPDILAKLDAKIIEKFIDLICEPGGRTPRFVLLLISLVWCGDKPVPYNQDLVTNKMLSKERNVLLPTRLAKTGDDCVLYIGDTSGPNDNVRWIAVNKYNGFALDVFRSDISELSSDDVLLRYHVETIRLLSKLLEGRNRVAFNRIIQLEDTCIQFDQLVDIVFNRSVPATVKAAYMELLLNVFLNRDPWEYVEPFQYYVFSNELLVSKSEEKASKYQQVYDDSITNPFDRQDLQKYKPSGQSFSKLKSLCLHFLNNHTVLNSATPDETALVKTVLETVSYMVKHGFYKILNQNSSGTVHEEIAPLIPAVVNILDVSTDLPSDQSKYELNEDNLVVMQVKDTCCELLNYLLDVRQKLRVDLVFGLFDSHLSRLHRASGRKSSSLSGDQVAPLIPIKHTTNLMNKMAGDGSKQSVSLQKLSKRGYQKSIVDLSALHNKRVTIRNRLGTQDMWNQYGMTSRVFGGDREVLDDVGQANLHHVATSVFGESFFHSMIGAADRFSDILLGLTAYDHPPLVEKAFQLLFTNMTQRAKFVQMILKVQCLRTDQSDWGYRFCKYHVRHMGRLKKWLPEEGRQMYRSDTGEDSYKRMDSHINALFEFIAADVSPEVLKQRQMILFNSGVVRVINDILDLPMLVNERMEPLMPYRRDLFQSCYSLLREIVKNNKNNQDALSHHLLKYSQHMGTKDLNVADTITACIKDNMSLLRTLPPTIPTKFVDLIMDYGKNPRWLRLFDAMVDVSGVPNKLQQIKTLKILLDNGILEVNGVYTNGGREVPRIAMLKEEEHKRPIGSFLQYHALSINLLAKCCMGKNRSNEVKVRAILPFDVLMEVLVEDLSHHKSPQVKKDSLRFMKTPYLRLLAHVYGDTNHPAAIHDIENISMNRIVMNPPPLSNNGKQAPPLLEVFLEDIWDLVNRLGGNFKEMSSMDSTSSMSGRVEEQIKVRPYNETDTDEKDREFHLLWVFDAIIPFISVLVRRHYVSLRGAMRSMNRDDDTLQVLLTDLLIALKGLRRTKIKEECLTQKHLELLSDVCLCLDSLLDETKVNIYELDSNVGEEEETMKTLLNVINPPEEWNPESLIQREWSYLIDDMCSIIGVTRSVSGGVVGIGTRSLAIYFSDARRRSYLELLCEFLMKNRLTLNSEFVLQGVRILRASVYMAPSQGQGTLNARTIDDAWKSFLAYSRLTLSAGPKSESQALFADVGAATLAIELVGHSDPTIRCAAVRLVNVLVQDGNKYVQETVATYLTETTMASFFSGIHEMISNASRIVKAQKNKMKGGSSKSIYDGDVSMEEDNVIMEVLVLLEDLSRGSFAPFQDLLRDQPQSISSFNILADVATYLMTLQSTFLVSVQSNDMRVAEIICQAYLFLQKAMFGNDKNQEAILDTKIVETTNRIMSVLNFIAMEEFVVNIEVYTRMKVCILSFLIAVNEGYDYRQNIFVSTRLIEVFEWKKMLSSRQRALDCMKLGGLSRNVRDLLITELNSYMMLTELLVNYDITPEDFTNRVDMHCQYFQVGCLRPRRVDNMCILHGFHTHKEAVALYRQHAATIELVREHELDAEKLFFHTHLYGGRGFNSLNDSLSKKMVEKMREKYHVDGNIRSRGLLTLLYDMIFELSHRQRFSQNKFLFVVPTLAHYVPRTEFVITVLLNLITIIFFSDGKLWYSVAMNTSLDDFRLIVYAIMTVLMLLHFLLSFVWLAVFFMYDAPLIVFRRMNATDKISEQRKRAQDKVPVEWSKCHYGTKLVKTNSLKLNWLYLVRPAHEMYDQMVIFFILAYPFFSGMGLIVSPYFYFYHLLDVVKDPTVKLVLTSLTRNRDKIMKTGLFALVIIYLFAIVTFLAYGDRLEECKTIYGCLITYIYIGSTQEPRIPIANILTLVVPEELWEQISETVLILIQSVFGLVFTLMLLAIISGIIIDSFGELRDEAQRIDEKMENYCYICGLPKTIFDDKGKGFAEHIKSDHNPLKYLSFIYYMENRPEAELTGQEVVFRELLALGDHSIFPVGKSVELLEMKSILAQESKTQQSQLSRIEAQVEQLRLSQLALVEENKYLRDMMMSMTRR